ncbi:MAG TPA: BlaI/MecI/CopY family transcriptional regulator [Candidatus Baltobacteraceae bacterium]|nr:BlaI/MecI/CopY family transcriptional regulator [Candidatus Baltobacteraceae bacterium]
MNLPLDETMEKDAQLPRLSKRSVLDLAPLELDCMNTLWPIGEGTVREIRDRLAPRRARAYTTIMTIMDRLARKGVVERRKMGRAYIYRPRLSAEEARAQAVSQVMEGFFGGSKEALLAHLGNVPARRAVAVAASVGGAPLATDVEAGETFSRERLDTTTV